MLAENLLLYLGFTDGQQKKYYEYKTIVGDRLDNLANAYMNGEISFSKAIERAHLLEDKQIQKFTINLMFVLECSSYLLEKYAKKGISKEIFINSMKDVKYKLEECISVYGVFGVEPVMWYERFLDIRRFALGRLQFNVAQFEEEDTTVNGYTVKKGDFVLACHIPSSGPLKNEMCQESFEMAYEFFKDKVNGGILPVICDSWLLYPPYKAVFGDNSNTGKFIKNFEIIRTKETEKFEDAWRVFGMDYNGETNNLPKDTSMQKGFANYIEQGGSFGIGIGLILLNGKKILTRN